MEVIPSSMTRFCEGLQSPPAALLTQPGFKRDPSVFLLMVSSLWVLGEFFLALFRA